MFRAAPQRPSRLRLVLEFLETIYHTTVHSLRGNYSNAVYGIAMNVARSLLILVMFVIMFDLLGMRRIAIRGDFILYVMCGVFMFLTFTKSLGAVAAAEQSTSSMMQHTRMNTVVALISAALAALYQQAFAAAVILFLYHATMAPIHIHDPVGMVAMFILSWLSGSAIGLLFYSAKPWAPDFVAIVTIVFQRANMIASGKMFPASYAPNSMRSMFDWNPLYHTIDQGRDAMFLNYSARYTSFEYPIYCALGCLMIGLIAQFFTRKYASLSWSARR